MNARACLLIGTVLFGACSDAAGPDTCALPRACEVEGVDLALMTVRAGPVVGATASSHDLLHAGDLDVSVTVMNRGTQTSNHNVDVAIRAFGAQANARVPAIAPGDSAVIVVPVVIERAYLYGSQEPEGQNITAELLTADAELRNNILNSPLYVLDLAHVTVQPHLLTLQTVPLGQHFTVRWDLEVGFLGRDDAENAISLLVCLRARGSTCTASGWDALLRSDQPRLVTTTTLVRAEARGAGVPAAGRYDIMLCTIPRTHPGLRVDLGDPDHHCEFAGQVDLQ